MTAPFFFESETAGLMSVRHRRLQSRRLFFRFPREDAAANYPCRHDGKKQPKLCLLHRGVRLIFGKELGCLSPTRLAFFLPTLRHLVPDARHFQVQRAFLMRWGRPS